jgi:hypothetical protein
MSAGQRRQPPGALLVDFMAVRASLARLDALARAHPRLTASGARWPLSVTLPDDPGEGGSKSSAIGSEPAQPDTYPDVPPAAHRDSDPNEEP